MEPQEQPDASSNQDTPSEPTSDSLSEVSEQLNLAKAKLEENEAKKKEAALEKEKKEMEKENEKGKEKDDKGSASSVDTEIDPADKEYKHFKISKVPVRHPFTNEVVDHELLLTFTEPMLPQYLKNYVPSGDSLYGVPPTAKADDLFQSRETLRQLATIESVAELMGFLDTQYGAITRKLENMVSEGKMSYKGLWYLFAKGKKIYGRTDLGHAVGAEVTSFNYTQGIFPAFDIQGAVIKANGKEFYTTNQRFRILPFEGTKPFSDLPVKVLDKETEEKLVARGRKFASVATGVHYSHHHGYVAQKEGWWGHQLYKADGRCMCDGVSFNRLNPNSRSSQLAFDQDAYHEQSNNFDHLPEDKLFMAWPTVLGFSFSAKKWGELTVDNLSPVEFDETAFDTLVLPPEKKALIRALVENCSDSFSDIITGKGGGCIFLLHGSPGVGKTLTAESIAELLKRPLYSVSVGELGTDTVELEKKLREILEVSSSWNAVILLDEADIFLEKRSENDITRNAMVGIFLRLLEYHQGVLFLTTNRVKCFDKAFHSRISIALKYDDLTEEARVNIWRNLLKVANIDGLDCEELGKHDLNGRQIRTMIRLALSLAKSEGQPVSAAHLERTISVASQFKLDAAINSE